MVALVFALSAPPVAAASIPRPDHVVVVVMENHRYDQVIGNPSAPYINGLAAQGASFTASYAVTHPSEPNYLALFSGSTQGVSDDSCPQTFSTENLGHELAVAGLTFAGFSEDMPIDGFTGCGSGGYGRSENPWVDFTNVPASANLTFAEFPSDYSTLPTVSFVVPNLCDSMHDCDVSTGDGWLHAHIDGYVQWARSHNSLLVLTWDEDDYAGDNRIPTIFVGAGVMPGNYGETIDHYRVLRTIEDMYGLGHAGNSAARTPITDLWAPPSGGSGSGGSGSGGSGSGGSGSGGSGSGGSGSGGSGGGGSSGGARQRPHVRLALGHPSLQTLVRSGQLLVRVYVDQTCVVNLSGSLRLGAGGRGHRAATMALPNPRLVFVRVGGRSVTLRLSRGLRQVLRGSTSALLTLGATCRDSQNLTGRTTLRRELR